MDNYSSDKTKYLFENYKYQEAIDHGKKSIEALKELQPIDSLEIAKHYLQIVPSYYKLRDYEKSILESVVGIAYCPRNDDGNNTKAGILYWRSFPEYFLNKPYQSYNTKLQTISILDELDQPDLYYLTAAYAEISLDLTFMGYLNDASYYVEKAYHTNKEKIEFDKKNGTYKLDEDLTLWLLYRSAQIYNKKNNERYDPILKDKLKQIIYTYKNYKQNNPNDWDRNKKVMYGAIHGYYGNALLNDNTSISRADSALYYYDKGLDQFSIEEHTFHHNLLTYNKSKAYELKSEYEKSLDIIEKLLLTDNPSSTAYLSHKASLFIALKDYDKWNEMAYETILRIHDSPLDLKKDFSNFVPSTSITQTSDILLLAESLEQHSNLPNELLRQKKKLYNLALIQFKKSYQFSEFNQRLNNYHKKIIKGILAINSNEEESDNVIIKALLSEAENIENRVAWEQFIKNRQIVNLPEIDSIEKLELKYREQLIEAENNNDSDINDSLSNHFQIFKNDIEKKFPKYYDFTQQGFDISEFQKLIPDKEVILKYVFFDNEFVVFQISKDNILSEIKPWESAQRSLLTSHLSSLSQTSKGFTSNDSLTQLLLPQKSFDYNSLVIIPNEDIYSLPFETLTYKDNFLGEHFAIRYSSHLRFIYYESDQVINEDTQVTLFAPIYEEEGSTLSKRSSVSRLEGAQKEASIVGNLFNTESFIGKTATKQNFIENKSKASILHLAMHATMDPVNPSFSHFNFADGGKLHLEELYALNIPIDLAVLSACNTAAGKQDNNMTIASLQRAFSYAGTEATIASLWDAPDAATSAIMVSFYKHLSNRINKSEALRLAKKDYINSTDNTKLKHPYYWAGFVLYGDDSPVTVVRNSIVWYVSGIVLIFLCVAIFILKRRKT